jgi:RimJ/RimL family protein N-acetyltransferase
VRPIAPADRDRLAEAFDALSERSRHDRFLGPKPRLSARELRYLTEVDHVSHEALVAIEEASGRIIGVARYAKGAAPGPAADVAVTVVDAWQRRGIGTALATRLIERARDNGIGRLTGTALAGNRAARALLDRLGFRVHGISGGVMDAALELSPAS